MTPPGAAEKAAEPEVSHLKATETVRASAGPRLL